MATEGRTALLFDEFVQGLQDGLLYFIGPTIKHFNPPGDLFASSGLLRLYRRQIGFGDDLDLGIFLTDLFRCRLRGDGHADEFGLAAE